MTDQPITRSLGDAATVGDLRDIMLILKSVTARFTAPVDDPNIFAILEAGKRLHKLIADAEALHRQYEEANKENTS